MKKFIYSVVIFVMAGAINVFGQSEEYINAVGKVLEANKSGLQIDKNQIVPTLAEILKEQITDENAINSIIEKYTESQYLEDMKQIMAGVYYKNGISIEELNELEKAYKNEKVQNAIKNMEEMQKQMSEVTQSYVMENIMNLISGKEIPNAELSETVSPKYFELIKNYSEANKSKELLENMRLSITNSVVSTIEDDNQKQQMTSIMNSLFTSLNKNYDVLLANASVGSFTQEDLKVITNFANSKEGATANKITKYITSDIINIGIEINNKFKTWYEKMK